MKKVATLLLMATSVTFSIITPVRAGNPQLPPAPPPCTEECRPAPAAEPTTTLPAEFRLQLLWALLSVVTR